MLLGVPDHAGPRLLFARSWGLGSWRSGFKTMKVLWLFILSLLWMSHSGTMGRDTSSHSRTLSWFLSPSLDAQHNMPMDRHAGVHAQLQGKTNVSWLLYIPLSLFLGRTHAHKHTFNFLNTALTRIAQRPSPDRDRSVRTSARRVNTVVFAFAEEVKDFTDPRVCQYDHNLGVVYVL